MLTGGRKRIKPYYELNDAFLNECHINMWYIYISKKLLVMPETGNFWDIN